MPKIFISHSHLDEAIAYKLVTGLGRQTTPAMKMGFCSRPVSIIEILNSRGFEHISF